MSDAHGNVIGTFQDYIEWESSRFLNEEGEWSMQLAEGHALFEFFSDPATNADAIVEYFRFNPKTGKYGNNPKFVGVFTAREIARDSAGKLVLNAVGSDGKALLIRAHNKYNSGTPQAQPNAPIDQIAHALVNNNLGSQATIDNGRWSNGVRSTVIDNSGKNIGAVITTDFSGENLYEVLTDFGESSDFIWDFVYLGAGKWQLQTHYGLLGKNRTNVGYDRNTLKNGYGETPVILTDIGETPNIIKASLEYTTEDEINAVCAFGESETEPIQVLQCYVQNDDSVTRSPWSRRETVMFGAGSTQNDVCTQANLELERGTIADQLSFEYRDTASATYCDDFDYGDAVTACVLNQTIEIVITGETIASDRDGETVTPRAQNFRQSVLDENIRRIDERLRQITRNNQRQINRLLRLIRNV